MHCNNGGFKRSHADVDFTHPRHWQAILKQRTSLKVCFGHFGGDECVATHTKPDIDSKNWTEVIHALMLEFPGRVFADLSYQTLPMTTEAGATAYLPKLRQFLANPKPSWG